MEFTSLIRVYGGLIAYHTNVLPREVGMLIAHLTGANAVQETYVQFADALVPLRETKNSFKFNEKELELFTHDYALNFMLDRVCADNNMRLQQWAYMLTDPNRMYHCVHQHHVDLEQLGRYHKPITDKLFSDRRERLATVIKIPSGFEEFWNSAVSLQQYTATVNKIYKEFDWTRLM
ncbi:MAG: hypothetical protein Faunusvirus34_4 [Faunusvirus sp.]|uniref:Uncharacterized protein n=1 Tax=Faunusvirus sp. TaxID=2487766 RepID=A0A3G5A2E6_9VIRU|nr:MAG: hypothetical protein Faunusvirus34_4 [Faunusvirus sp.]